MVATMGMLMMPTTILATGQHAVSVFDDIFFESDKYRIRTNPNNKSDDETSRLV